ncbi:RlpA-like double-psi beta-barrel-protein domain-containing protein-containing protein [Lipomyces doorenjongii]|uniref:RlpA-like double-psi beta-barrel-protein domain-containing protein-containing protein n=1 Tax=Lipomyces doorenjongii TaxID=383834 RepID=UPI0034CE4F84
MRSFFTFLTLASAALAAPFDKRAITWVTVTENVDYVQTLTVVQTVVVYASASPSPDSFVSTSMSSVAPTSTVVYQQDIVSSILSDSSTSTTLSSVSTSTTSTPAVSTTSSSSVQPTPTTPSTSVESTTSSSYVEPQPTTSTAIEPATSTSSVYFEPTPTSTYVEPTTTETPTSTYVQPITTEIPTSTYVQPTTTETPTSTYAQPTPSSTAAPSSSISVSTSTHSTGTGTYSGDGTFYSTGLGSCGITSADTDYIVAVSYVLMDANSNGNPNTNPLCGKTITAYRDTSFVTVTVVDTCRGCAEYDLDFSPSAFEQLGQQSEGRIPITWSWD